MIYKKATFSIIEIIIDIAIISLVSIGIITLMIANIRNASYSQMRFVAANLANQRLEEVRNLPYDQIATEHGIILPQGNLKDNEEIVFASQVFDVSTVIIWYDDPYDGTSPTDTAPYDYKKVTIRVMAQDRPVIYSTVTTNIGSRAAETTSNTGILLVKVVDGVNQPVEEASVHVTHASPAIDITAPTDSQGLIMIPLLPPGTGYTVSATKSGFSTDTTVDPATCDDIPTSEATANPIVLLQDQVEITLQIRCLVDLNITAKDQNNQLLPNQQLRVMSSRRFCADPLLYRYNQLLSTDLNGLISVPQIENDSYHYALP